MKPSTWRVDVEGDVPPELVELCRERRARRVRSILGQHYVVELQTRTATGPIFIRVNAQGEQIRTSRMTGTDQRPLEAVAAIWPISHETKAA